jgi:hypothetical protein
MADIEVTRTDPEYLRVEVTEAGSTSVHDVKVTGDDIDQLAAGSSAEALVEESFRFLLEREPQDSIMRRFDLQVISRYFPEYSEEIGKRLGAP